ncbi:MAG: LptF/LptG family permease [Alphaproteobacteria bacterium]|nr:MAG: LptF/LptG family permease [Alphaproteobacteria bacterium]
MFRRIDRYVLRLTLLPMAITLCIAAMLLTLDKMLRLFDFVVNEGGPVSVVWRMLGNLVPQYLGLAVPIGVFMGSLFAFRRLAINSELDALVSGGISHLRLLRAPIYVAGVMALANLVLIGFIQPVSRYHYAGLQFDLRSGALGASIKVGEFVHIGDDLTLRIEESREEGRKLMRVFLARTAANGNRDIVSATSGTFFATDDRDRIVLRLYDGAVVTTSEKLSSPRTLTFAVHDLPVNLPQSKAFRGRGAQHLEMTLPELYRARFDPALSAEERRAARANLHFRMVNIFTILLMPFLGAAMGVPPKRSQSALGVFAGVALLVVFNEIIEFGEDFSARGATSPIVSQWLAYAVFAAFVFQLFRILAFRPGGQPLRGLEIVAKQAFVLLRWLRRLFRHWVPA